MYLGTLLHISDCSNDSYCYDSNKYVHAPSAGCEYRRIESCKSWIDLATACAPDGVGGLGSSFAANEGSRMLRARAAWGLSSTVGEWMNTQATRGVRKAGSSALDRTSWSRIPAAYGWWERGWVRRVKFSLFPSSPHPYPNARKELSVHAVVPQFVAKNNGSPLCSEVYDHPHNWGDSLAVKYQIWAQH